MKFFVVYETSLELRGSSNIGAFSSNNPSRQGLVSERNQSTDYKQKIDRYGSFYQAENLFCSY